jgi:uncharacterized protein
MSGSAQVEVVDNPEEGRFEIRLDGETAGAAYYRLDEGRIVLTHTEVDRAHEGKGLGGRLARGVLDEVRSRGLAAMPMCPFMAGYIRSHPEYLDVVAPELRPQLASG